MKSVISFIMAVMTVFMMSTVSAAKKKKEFELSSRGCCSRHGGAVACIDGKVKCDDGTFSEGCTCKKK